MKSKNIIPFFLATLALFAMLLQACKKDSLEIPPASTQADFTYEVNVIIDEETALEQYEVKLFNKSLLAKSVSWDFGNGETSTQENPVVTFTTSGKYTITLTATPTNDVYYNKLTKSVNFAFGKQVVLFEDFNEGIDHIDDDYWVPEGWLAVDNDGDTYNWYVGERQGVVSMRSQSYADGSALNPDNWLITPELDLTNFADGASVTFRYTVGITANTPVYRKENYGVFIAVGNNNLSSFQLLFEETFTEETPNWTSLERTIDLSDYAGEIIYLAIRHYNVTDMDRMFVDEVELFVIE